jgi:hypothetical protein
VRPEVLRVFLKYEWYVFYGTFYGTRTIKIFDLGPLSSKWYVSGYFSGYARTMRDYFFLVLTCTFACVP